jgi:AcrR family transcriptional regulator
VSEATLDQAVAPRRGRPSTGARERILAAALEVMKAEGYAGTTLAKVAARAGESKGLVAYHYGSKQGLVAAVAKTVAELITEEVLSGISEATDVESVIAGTAAGVERVLDGDERLARVYFDLAAVSVVDPEVRSTIAEINEGWREVLIDLLRDAGMPASRAKVMTVMVIACVQGFALERIERGNTPQLRKAQELFVRSAVSAAD